MSLREIVIEGTLNSDGTLELAAKPNLSPGRVKVILQPAQGGASAKRGIADVIDERASKPGGSTDAQKR